jgi:hypothetical protein
MGKYAKKAEHHADKIRYFHAHAGRGGYSQAELHYELLSGLIGQAHHSNNDKDDVARILNVQRSVHPLMEEMKRRAEESNPA